MEIYIQIPQLFFTWYVNMKMVPMGCTKLLANHTMQISQYFHLGSVLMLNMIIQTLVHHPSPDDL